MSAALAFAAVAFEGDEQRVNVGGHNFNAVAASAPGKCKGCHFINGFGCSLSRGVAAGSTKCMSAYRADGRDIIWIGAWK